LELCLEKGAQRCLGLDINRAQIKAGGYEVTDR
jgi:hypothetical protein